MVVTAAVLVAVSIAASVMTRVMRRYALARLIDIPNDRSSHRIPTPRGGGLAVVIAFYAGCFALILRGLLPPDLFLALASGIIVAAAGFWDDHGHVPARLRLAAHAVAGVCGILALGGFPELPLGALAIPLSGVGALIALLWLTWMLNLFNFMDGIDAIAGTEAMFVACSALAVMAFSPECVGASGYALAVLAAAVMGFQWWNWPPAKIFMGDVGSGFVGFSVALIALADMRRPDGGLGFPVWVILNGVFLVDATYTLLRRMVTGQAWYAPHRSHAYQKAAMMLGGHRPVVIYVLLFNALWLFPCALAATRWPGLALPILSVALVPLLAVAVWLKAGDP